MIYNLLIDESQHLRLLADSILVPEGIELQLEVDSVTFNDPSFDYMYGSQLGTNRLPLEVDEIVAHSVPKMGFFKVSIGNSLTERSKDLIAKAWLEYAAEGAEDPQSFGGEPFEGEWESGLSY
jgi:hypothetical protein